MNLLEKFRDMNLSISLSHDRIELNPIQVISDLKREIKEAQTNDEFLQKKKKLVKQKNGGIFVMDREGILNFRNRICVPNDDRIKKMIIIFLSLNVTIFQSNWNLQITL